MNVSQSRNNGLLILGIILLIAIRRNGQDGPDGMPDPLWEIGDHIEYRVSSNPLITDTGIISDIYVHENGIEWGYDLLLDSGGTVTQIAESRIIRLVTNGDGGDNGPDPIPGDVFLRADADQDTYRQINGAFANSSSCTGTTWQDGCGIIEGPDTHTFSGSRRHWRTIRGGGPHGQDYFRSFIHPNDVNGANGDPRGRTRNEIKGQRGRSPSEMLFSSGDVARLHWYFRVGANYNQPSGGDGCYVHQLHSIERGPIIKLLIRSGNRLDLTHDRDNLNRGTERSLGSISFGSHRGAWLEADEHLECRNSGFYELSLHRVDTGERIFHVRETNIDMLAGTMRPKWGAYRPRLSGYNSEDTFDFADFLIHKD